MSAIVNCHRHPRLSREDQDVDASDDKQPKATSASSIEPRRPRFLWRDRVPEAMLTLIAGRPGTAKSLLTAFIASEVTRKGKNVIFSNLEDPPHEVVIPRLAAAGADLERVHLWSMRLPEEIESLELLVREHAAALVVLDPIAAHLSVTITNDQQVRRALAPVADVAARTRCAVLMVGHTVKQVSRGAHPITAIGGSAGGIVGAARAVYLFGESPKDPDTRVLCPVKFNLAPQPKAFEFEVDSYEIEDAGGGTMETGRIVFVGESSVSAEEVLRAGSRTTPGPSPHKRQAAADWLVRYLALGPRPVKELREDAAHYGMSWATIRRAADDIQIEKFRVGFGKEGINMWKLPIGHAQADDETPTDESETWEDEEERD